MNISGTSGCSNGSYVFTYIYTVSILFELFYYFELAFCIIIGDYFYIFVGDCGSDCCCDFVGDCGCYTWTVCFFYGGDGIGIFNDGGWGWGWGGYWTVFLLGGGDGMGIFNPPGGGGGGGGRLIFRFVFTGEIGDAGVFTSV